MTTSENLYIRTYLPDNVLPVVAGRLQINERAGTAAGQVGTFVYGRSYLARKDAVAIDPVTLPLKPGPHTFTTLKDSQAQSSTHALTDSQEPTSMRGQVFIDSSQAQNRHAAFPPAERKAQNPA